MKDKIYLGEINNYFDQDLWAKLDWNLPEKDMHRGMINLKLARTLMNFTNSKKIWDPFCGYGRNLIAGIDLKNSLIASDLDEKCLAPTQKNFQYSQEFFSLKRLTKGKKLALLKNVFQADVKEFGHLKKIESLNLVHYNKISTEIEKEIKQNLVEMVGEEDKLSDRQKIQSVKFEENFEKLAIVTEGYLGKNFSFLPSSQDVEKEFNIIEKIWLKALKNFEKLEISEIVFCLPFYKIQKRIFLPEFYSQLITGTGYKFEMLDKTNNKGYLLYSRKESIVGHFILKVCL